jgi:hypothetical protein
MREDESDLPFLVLSVAKRRYASPAPDAEPSNDNAPRANHRGRSGILERETGIASQLRWRSASQAKLGREPATLSLGM